MQRIIEWFCVFKVLSPFCSTNTMSFFRTGVWKSALGYMARATHLCTCRFCWFKTHFSFLTLENGSAKPPAVRLLQNMGCEVHCLGQIPHQIIPLRRWFQLGIVIFASCLILQHCATEQLLISSSPGLAACHSGPATSPPCSLPCSQTLYGKAANDGKCFEFLSWNLCLLLWLFFAVMEQSRILKTFLLFLQICHPFPWIRVW